MVIVTQSYRDKNILLECNYPQVVALEDLNTPEESPLDHINRLHSILMDSDIILLTYRDEGGAKIDKEMIKRYGVRVKIVDKAEMGDSLLEAYVSDDGGVERIKRIIRSAEIKIPGLMDLSKEPYLGIEQKAGRYVSTGLNTIDYAINDLGPGRLSLITGRANEGKTTLVTQIAAKAIDNNHSVLWISGEGILNLIINRFYQAVIGKHDYNYDLKKINKRYFKEPKPEVLKALRNWHDGKLHLLNKGDSPLKSMPELFEVLEYEVKSKQHNLVIIDNLMSVLSVERASEKWEAQADFAQRCSNLAKAYNTHIILVLHPNKTVQKGQRMEFDQISGTQDLPNKADIILYVRREFEASEALNEPDGEISVLKNRDHPELPTVPVRYDRETGTLNEISPDGSVVPYVFRWQAQPDWMVEYDDD